MSRTYFNLDINDVLGPEGNGTSADLTTQMSLENLKEELAKSLECEIEELDFSECTYSAEEDFLITILGLENGKEPNDDLFDNITTIEKSNISLDIINAANETSSSKDFDTIMSHATDDYIGSYLTESEFADSYCEDYMDLEIPQIIQGCIDWQRVWDSTLRHDHSHHHQYYFKD